jgi:1,4-alpha-glucan branching enzyme
MMYTFSENFILAYSHDEVVHGKKSMVDKMFGSYEEKFATLRALYGYQFAHPGKKLTFMGSEFGQFIEWNFKQGLDWLLLTYPRHVEMQRYSRALNHFYTAHNALWNIDDSWDGFRWLNVDDAERSSIAFMRTSRSKRRVVCVCNFTPVRYDNFLIGLPKAGVLREVLSSDDTTFGGSGIRNESEIHSEKVPFNDLPYSAKVTLPPLSCVYFTFTSK